MPTPSRTTTRKNKLFKPILAPIPEHAGPIVPGSRFTIVNERHVKLPKIFKRGGKRTTRRARKL